MQKVVGVRFKPGGKVYYFSPGEIELEPETQVVVETSRGLELGEVVLGIREVKEEEVVNPLKAVLRRATDKDLEQVRCNREKEEEAFAIGEQKIEEHQLPMKLIDVEYTFEANKIVFYFTAEGRVDFRELVKDLASVFRTRIELRQIGVRDEAKILGGLGPCGRVLCCNSFLGDFEPVSIRMAKEQNLSLNPSKISGLCGRLMCCLRYENEAYECARAEMPKENSRVETPQGTGVVTSLNLLRGRVTVKGDEDGVEREFEEEEVYPPGCCPAGNERRELEEEDDTNESGK